MLPNLSGLCNRNEAPVGAPAWFDEAELDYSNEVRNNASTAAEFMWQVYNEMQKYEKSKYDPSSSLERVVKRLLNYWHFNEGYDPGQLMGMLIGAMTSRTGRIMLMTARDQSTEFEIPRATRHEVMDAAKTWLRGVNGGLTHEEEVNLNQAIKNEFDKVYHETNEPKPKKPKASVGSMSHSANLKDDDDGASFRSLGGHDSEDDVLPRLGMPPQEEQEEEERTRGFMPSLAEMEARGEQPKFR